MTLSSSLIGAQLGSYHIQSVIGSGGMSTVYQATDVQLRRPVAVKVLTPHLADNPEYVQRFRREAQLVAGLRHPNIAHVYALGEQDGAIYMVQELLPGPTLDARAAELRAAGQSMAPGELLADVGQLAAALDAAHGVGVIHRDVKPSNAIFNASGQLVLTDFGIAHSPTDDDSTLTQPGMLLGTPAYLSPEQALGEPLTPAADIYALGVLTYQLLTGQVPFEAPTPMAVLRMHANTTPRPPSQLSRDLPAAVDAAVLRALAKSPADRFPTAGAFAQALSSAFAQTVIVPPITPTLERSPVAAPATPAHERGELAALPPLTRSTSRGSRWLPLALLAVVLLATLGLWRWGAWGTSQAEGPGDAIVAAEVATRTIAVTAESPPPRTSVATGTTARATTEATGSESGETAGAIPVGGTQARPQPSPASTRQSTAPPAGGAAQRSPTLPPPTRDAVVPPAAPGVGVQPQSTAAQPTRASGGSSRPTAPRPPARIPTAAVRLPSQDQPAPTAASPRATLTPRVVPSAQPTTARVVPTVQQPVVPTVQQPLIPPTVTPVPPTATDAPPPPTDVPPPPTDAPPPPTDVPPPPQPTDTGLAELSSLIDAGIADGRAGSVAPQLAALNQHLTAAVAAGDGREARKALRDLGKTVEVGLRQGSIDPAFGAELSELVEDLSDQDG
ncbi:MAG: hypothetical protein RLZZ387_4469 [Chloroflexota bacterium]